MPVAGLDLSEQYHQSIADLRLGRRTVALPALDNCFRGGTVPSDLNGVLRGRLLATTVSAPVDAYARAATRVWMPWKGKVLDAQGARGRNLFSNGWRPLMRVAWPGYDDVRPQDADHLTTFGFKTWIGPSVETPEIEVFKIDYDVPTSPRFVIQSVLDELVQIEPGLFLGQALLRRRGRWSRVAWFELSST